VVLFYQETLRIRMQNAASLCCRQQEAWQDVLVSSGDVGRCQA